jgi:hypothetical protein
VIGPGDRKSVQHLAMHFPRIGDDQMHHFIGSALWDSAPPVNANTTLAICLPPRRSRSWPVPPKPVGSTSRLTNSSNKSSALTTPRDDHGRDYTDTP